MSLHQFGWVSKRWAAFLVMSFLMVGLVCNDPIQAADLDKLESAVQEMPADTAFFGSWLRNREQVEAVLNSKAWAKLLAQPFAKLAVQALSQPGGPADAFQQWYQQAENQQLVHFLLDLGSQEIYVAGGSGWADFSKLVADVYNTAMIESALADLTGKDAGRNEEEKLAQAVVAALQQHSDHLQIPELLIGFKVSDVQRAQTQLKRLEPILEFLATQKKELKGRLKKAKVGNAEFMTITLDGKMVPWEQVPPFQQVEKPEQYKPLIKKLQDLQLTIGLGLRGKYVLLALGPSLDHVARLGQGQRLIDRTELKPLEKFADQKFTSINYASKEFMSRIGNKNVIESYLNLGMQFLAKAELKPEQKARIKKDLEALTKEIQAAMPQAGAILDFSFLSKRGYEGYTFDWGENRYLDGSKPLTILNHVGGTPLVVVAGRSKIDPTDWSKLVRWVKVVHGYFEEFAVPQMPAEERQKYQQFMQGARPLLARLNETTAKLLLPSLADGQTAFVLDAKLTSRQWHEALPQSAVALPMLEPALVVGVSDADKLQKAAGEYRVLLNGLIAEARKLSQEIGAFEIPPPQSRKLKNGITYFYPLPEVGLDKRLVPNATVADRVAVLSISQEHAERLLTATPFKIDGGPLAHTQRPLAAATYVDCAGILDAVGGWVEYGWGTFRAVGVEQPVRFNAQQDDTLKQIRAVFEVLKVFRSHASATYLEKGVKITHRETVLRDLP